MRRMFGAVLGRARDAISFSEQALTPLLLLGVRVWLFSIFTRHGLEKAMRNPDLAFGVDLVVTIEVLAAGLLLLGLMTRIAAIPIAVLSLFVYFGQHNISGHILCALLALSLTIQGPGAISLDRLIQRGLARSALPFAQWPERIFSVIERLGGPALRLLLRVWMGGFFWVTGEALLNPGPTPWIDYGSAVAPEVLAPFQTDPQFMWAQLVLGVALTLGLAGRFAAFALTAITLAVLFGPEGRPEHLLWALILANLLFAGPGALSLDQLIGGWLRRRFPEFEIGGRLDDDAPHVVIVGAGFGGLAVAKGLRRARAQVTVIDRHNYHLFQPLLYQVATAGLSPADIAMPIRGVLRDHANTRVLYGSVTGVDAGAKHVLLGQRRVPFDYLVLATGARHDYFGRDDWEPRAPGLKTIDDATHLRQRILLAFERAEAAIDPVEQRRYLTFAVVGGGPTGVELAGAIAELAKQGMADDFRAIDPSAARVILVQAAPRVLPMFPEELSAEAQAALERMGVEVRVNSRVTEIDEVGARIGDELVPAGTVLWAAGVRASPAARWLGAPADRAGRVRVEPDLTAPGHDAIYVIGDTAAATSPDGGPVPGLAPAAKQAGTHVAKAIRARIRGRRGPGPFRYRHLGSLATIGRAAAIADFGRIRLSGGIAWWLWGVVHVFFLLGVRNRLSVMINWAWSYVSYRSSTRLITGDSDAPSAAAAARPAAAE